MKVRVPMGTSSAVPWETPRPHKPRKATVIDEDFKQGNEAPEIGEKLPVHEWKIK